ncbi:hypothetical protein EST38_g13650 [Candolleomyces aberdarensis]|uniref:F-box domain-containing protein n=1 Tax=Candolleomyces aberdarensis TaxID=2316362 RepID=A0A4Q2D178_9AGAR|nr:hypothetical protein EST38_g13650 [Candolleomyces aberdarensis]
MLSAGEQCLKSLSTSNRPPSPQEASVAGEYLQLCDQKLQVVDTRITALEHELEQLKTQRTIIERERHRYADILSARRLLPPEIIGRFMELACMYDSESSRNLETHQQVSSFMLVSREWYRTACGVAHFWTELAMDLTNYSAEETQSVIVKASNRSARASELYLSLHIAFSAAAPANTQIFDFIHSLVPRLGLLSLRIQVDSTSDLVVLDTLFHPPPSSSALVWPTLHTLQISIQSQQEITADAQLSFLSSNFPLLRTAAISSSNISFTSYQMPWFNLMRLDLGPLGRPESQKYVSIIGACTNLRSLHLCTQSYIDINGINSVPVITLPHLTHLHVESSGYHDGEQLLPLLNVPSLQSCIYTVSVTGSYSTSIVRRLTDLFRRSGCSASMKYLELDLSRGTFYSPNALRNLFLEVPHLTVLKLSGYKMEVDALREVPLSVRELSIKISYYRVDDSRKTFVDYLNSRFASSTDIPVKARLHLADTVHTLAVRKRLDSLKKEVGSALDVVMD